MDLQHWSIINLEMVNWKIYLLYSPSKSLQFWGIKNEGLEVVETPPNPSKPLQTPLPHSLKNFHIRYLNYSPSLYSTPPSF